MRQRLASLAALLLLAAASSACGSSVVNPGTGGCADTGHCLPACPDPLPGDGPCPVLGQKCGQFDECGNGAEAECKADGWDLTWYDSGNDCSCGPGGCPPCPAAQPLQGSACELEGHTCSYTSPSCNEAGADATCINGAWDVSQYGPACLGICPEKLPVEGTACDGCCVAGDCTYFDASGCPALLACNQGIWTVSPSNCTPPSPCATLDMGACTNAQGCRWMQYAGCPTTFQSFTQGCYPVPDCTSDADCAAGTTCKAVEVDPCPAGDCNACSAEARLCTP